MDLRTFAKSYLPASVTGALRLAKYNYEIWSFPKTITTHRYGTSNFTVHIEDRVAKEWYDRDWELPHEIEFLASHGLRPGALVFDLGAHQCVIAMMLAKQVGPDGRVVAVEANRHNVRVAERNFMTNRIVNVEVVHALISSKIGMDRAATSFNSRREGKVIASDQVSALTIDRLAQSLGTPDVIYMDIEGFELEALKGATNTLKRACTWFIELHGDDMLTRYGASNHEILRYFSPDEFRAYVCGEDETAFHLLRGNPPHERCFMVFVPLRPGEPQV